jgi:hypothetical protein
MFSRRTLKILAVTYAIKTLAVGVAWLMVPDLPQRASTALCRAWVWAGGAPNPAHTHPHVLAVAAPLPR